ncbi:MAG: transcription/translation regulatory transformer protein RfaH [Proteobacteria bacterium]|nr:transcription/translation regulatory transformer protein RfaH [Pseudomonadota bacterium]
MKNWYLIHTKPKQESVAKENLLRQNYCIYLPMAVTRRRRDGRTKRTVEALFPRYLFIHLDDSTDDWAPIRSTIGVSKLVRFGIIPAKISEDLGETIKKRENEEGIHELQSGNFEEGQKVRIAEGPFEGYEAIFKSKSGRERAVLLLNIAQNMSKIQIDIDKIESTI